MLKCWLTLNLIVTLGACSTAPLSQASPNAEAGIDQPLRLAMIAVHNRERRAFGVSPLTWDAGIAAQASIHAAQLARIGRLQHSTRQVRGGLGENLWIGTRGGYPFAAMAERWASERRLFRPGSFPANSRTGYWADVGHFTQMIWPSTSRIGCGVASAGQWAVLVCRYAPAGNVDGVMIPPR